MIKFHSWIPSHYARGQCTSIVTCGGDFEDPPKAILGRDRASRTPLTARIAPTGAIGCGDQIELCPDALYMQLTGKMGDVLSGLGSWIRSEGA